MGDDNILYIGFPLINRPDLLFKPKKQKKTNEVEVYCLHLLMNMKKVLCAFLKVLGISM